MNITITRQQSQDWGTPGHLVVEETGFECETLELPWRDNAKGVSCIMADSYTATVWHSDHLGVDTLRLEDKHGRADCLIHQGNFAGDTEMGLETQVHGCTLPGASYGNLARTDGQGIQQGILKTRTVLAGLLANIGAGPHVVTYRWAEGCEP